jgi:hypothetical protein
VSKLPEPPVSPDCDMSDVPFPHALLVQLSADAFGATEQQTIDLAVSLGMTRVAGGWVKGVAGNG